jgi:hypothetical protein
MKKYLRGIVFIFFVLVQVSKANAAMIATGYPPKVFPFLFLYYQKLYILD